MDILNKTAELFQSWEAADVKYCHWKSNEHLYEGLVGETDLDVLVSPECKENARTVLQNCGYISLASQYGSRYPEVEDWIGYDKDTGRMIHIHLHFRMATGHRGLKEYSLPWAERAMEERIKDEQYDVYICPPEYEIVILFTRIGLKANFRKTMKAIGGKYHLPKDEKKEIDYLLERVDYTVVNRIVGETFKKDADEVFNIIKKGDLSSKDFLKLKKTVARYMKKNRTESGVKLAFDKIKFGILVPFRNILKGKLHFMLVTKKTLGEGAGITIAFMGQDGAGKSTVTDEIKKWLSWKVDVRKVYLGSGDHYFSLRKKLITKLKKSSNGAANVLRGILSVGDSKKLAKTVYKNIKKAEKYKKKGGIVLYDRYPQVKFPGINDGPKIREKCSNYLNKPVIGSYMKHCAKIEEKYLARAVEIAPDLLFKLILRPEVSIQRKPQEKLENVQRKHEIIKSLEFNDSEVMVIDAEMNYEEEVIAIKSKIWEIMDMHSKKE